MLRNLIAATLIMSCVGCQTVGQVFVGNEQVEQLSNKTAFKVEQLSSLAIAKGERAEIKLQQGSQYLQGYGIESPVAMFELPSSYEIMQLYVRSYYDLKFFAPSALVIDGEGNILSQVTNDDFKYKPGDLFDTYRQEAQLRISPLQHDTPIYVIVYTTENDANDQSTIWVKKDRTMEEEAEVIPHGYIGRVSVEFDALAKSDTVILAGESGLEVKTLEYNTERVENIFDELRVTIKEGNTQKALDLVDQIQNL